MSGRVASVEGLPVGRLVLDDLEDGRVGGNISDAEASLQRSDLVIISIKSV